MIVYNLYVFLLYAFYANGKYESSSAVGKVIVVISFFVATSFWDLAIHWSEFKFTSPDVVEEADLLYETVEEEEGRREVAETVSGEFVTGPVGGADW